MDWHPIQGGVEILLVASCHGNPDKLRPDGPLGSYADFTLLLGFCSKKRGDIVLLALSMICLKVAEHSFGHLCFIYLFL